jgi:predicted phosphodiesterase
VAKKKSTKNQKAQEIVSRFPNTGNSALADLLFSANPVLYKDKEEARTFIRFVRGAQGKLSRAEAGKEVKHFENGKINVYDLPKQEHNFWEPLVINVKKQTKVGIVSDIHIPYQDNSSVDLALTELKNQEIEILILNGDISDNYQESEFTRDPNKRKLKEEVAIMKNFLSALRREFPKTRIIYKEGNHEYRHKAYLARKSPEIFGFEETKYQNLLGLDKFDIEWVDNKRLIELGKLTVVHGHEFGKQIFSPVNPAKGFYTKAKKSVIGGHHHQISSHSAKTINGKQHVAYSVGCLCDLTPEYMPINEWSHGFAWVDLSPDGTFVVHNKKIVQGKIV